MDEQAKLARAKQKVEAMMGFYIHLIVFTLVIILLFAINYADGPDWWVQWPLLGWGIGIAVHAFAVFGRMPNRITLWQLRKIRDLKERM